MATARVWAFVCDIHATLPSVVAREVSHVQERCGQNNDFCLEPGAQANPVLVSRAATVIRTDSRMRQHAAGSASSMKFAGLMQTWPETYATRSFAQTGLRELLSDILVAEMRCNHA